MTKPPLRVLMTAVIILLAGCSGSSQASKPPAPITVRLELDKTTVQAGTPITGTAILTNTTSKTISFRHCPSDWLQVGLEGKRYHYVGLSQAMLCSDMLHLVPGPHRFPIVISTTYGSCIQTRLGGEGKGMPPCIGAGDDEAPPLPASTYTTKTFIEAPEAPAAPPITVTVLAPAS